MSRERLLQGALGMKRINVWVLTLSLVACTESVGPADVQVPVQTDAESYTFTVTPVGLTTWIRYTIKNRTSGPIYIPNCYTDGERYYFLGLEKETAPETWMLAWSRSIPLCLADPVTISAGASYRDSVWVFGGFPDKNVSPKFSIQPMEGRYRIVITRLLSSYDPGRANFGDTLGIQHRISNPFTLDDPRD